MVEAEKKVIPLLLLIIDGIHLSILNNLTDYTRLKDFTAWLNGFTA